MPDSVKCFTDVAEDNSYFFSCVNSFTKGMMHDVYVKRCKVVLSPGTKPD